MQTLSLLVRQRAADRSDGVFLSCDGTETTFAALHNGVQHMAGALAAANITPDCRVGLMLGQSLTHIELFMACAWIGATVVPFSVHFQSAGLELQLTSCRPEIFVADRVHADVLRRVVETLATPPLIVWVESEGDLRTGETTLTSLRANATPVNEPVNRSLTDTLAIIYTSGTTGAPKGGVMSEGFFQLGAKSAGLLSDVQPDDVYFLWEPFYHASAWMMVLMALQHGAKLHMVKGFSASRLWDQIREARATKFHYLGGLINIILAQPERPNDRDNPVTIAWGAACPADSWRLFEERFGVSIREGYGLTEAQNFTHINRDGIVGSIGKPIEEIECWLVDDAGTRVGPGVTGEIVVAARSPAVGMTGYWDDPAKTAEVLHPDGTIHTGDLAMMDADGNYYFKGRKKDSLRRRGENISAWEVERVINSAPGVEESAVVGVRSDMGEQEVFAAIKLRDGAAEDPAAIIAHCADRLAYYQVPRFLSFVDDFPRGPTQRIRKADIPTDIASAWDTDKLGITPRRKH